MNDMTHSSKVLALGVGSAGSHIIRTLKLLYPETGISTAVIDTDSSVLENHPADAILAASSDWNLRTGTGCGGDIIRGERALVRERQKIIGLLHGYDLIIVTAGLGGGTATGGLRTIASVIRAMGTPSIFLPTLPFSTENFARRKNAESCLSDLICQPNVVMPVPNDLLYSRRSPDASAAEAMSLANAEMASTVMGIAGLLRCKDYTGADYAVFLNALNRHKTQCGIGIGRAAESDGDDRTVIAIQRMLDAPFLGGHEQLKNADAVIMILSGGSRLTLAEMKRAMEQCAALIPEGVETILGVNTDEKDPDLFQITAIAIKYDDDDPKAENKRQRRNAVKDSKPVAADDNSLPLFQGELGLTSLSRGVFDKVPVIKYKDEDLDIPVFQRRGLMIDKGE